MNRVGIAVLIMVALLCVWVFVPRPNVFEQNLMVVTHQADYGVKSPGPVVTTSEGQVLQTSQHINLVGGDDVRWVTIERSMCYEVNLARDGECITTYRNTEDQPRSMCQGKPTDLSGVVFQLGLQADHDTTVAVDLFPCKR